MITKHLLFLPGITCLLLAACTEMTPDKTNEIIITKDSSKNADSLTRWGKNVSRHAPRIIVHDTATSITTSSAALPGSLVSFAETLIGTPYKYASADPSQGFDCSGFITYVFNHFNITVPRSSIDFTNTGIEVSLQDAKRGDIILFTGTDSTEKFVGHTGLVTDNNNGSLKFIHSSSGKANGVTITGFNEYYRKRFVKVVRIVAPESSP